VSCANYYLVFEFQLWIVIDGFEGEGYEREEKMYLQE
jgi:hypothetical protein